LIRYFTRHCETRIGRYGEVVIAGLDPAIHQSWEKLLAKKMDARVISAFTRVFDALLPAHDRDEPL